MPEIHAPQWPPHFLDRGADPDYPGNIAATIATQLRLPPAVAEYLCQLYMPLAGFTAKRAKEQKTPFIMGVNGAQGTGKSTAAHILKTQLEQSYELSVCALSIDDLYLSHAERQRLAGEIHPLLATRGVPGTHDLALALGLFEALNAASERTKTPIPRFDKAQDDCLPREQWDIFPGRPDVILFEGWCVGARPQREGDLAGAVNSLESHEDARGDWRRYVNACLGEYQRLFQQLDFLVMLKAPSFDQVLEWRQLQEDKLRERLTPEQLAQSRVMTPDEVRRFIAHYERLTRWMLSEMPARSDVLLSLAGDHQIANIECHT